MSDQAVKAVPKTKPRSGVGSYRIADGVTLYEGQLVQLESGYLNHWDETGKFLGILRGGADRAGDGIIIGETADSLPPEGYLDESGVTLCNMAVAGTVTIADVGALVYCADSNPANLTKTATATRAAIGRIKRVISAGVADVELFTPTEYAARTPGALTTAGIYCLSIPVQLATIAADTVTSLVIPHAFKIVRFDATVTTAATTAAKAATLNIEIGTTNLTGGTIALTSANCTPLGAQIAGAAITAANEGAAGAAISVEGASITAFVEGAVMLTIWIQNIDSL